VLDLEGISDDALVLDPGMGLDSSRGAADPDP
jgi:hypothetical protein